MYDEQSCHWINSTDGCRRRDLDHDDQTLRACSRSTAQKLPQELHGLNESWTNGLTVADAIHDVLRPTRKSSSCHGASKSSHNHNHNHHDSRAIPVQEASAVLEMEIAVDTPDERNASPSCLRFAQLDPARAT